MRPSDMRPKYSHQSMGLVERTNGLAAGLLRTFRLALERRLNTEISPDHPIVPFLVNCIGWYITRFQPRDHGGSSFKFLYGHEYKGEIADFGELVWYRIAARVSAGRGKYEPRFAQGIWVGKSEVDDSHLVIDVERGVQKARTVRRMPQEFRWNADRLMEIRVTPWSTKQPREAIESAKRNMYITERMIDAHGTTDSCPKCTDGKGQHSQACRERFERIQSDLLNEKLKSEPVIEQRAGDINVPVESTVDRPDAVMTDLAVQGAASGSGGQASIMDVADGDRVDKRQRVATIRDLAVCELAVCEDGDSELHDPPWDPVPAAENRCEGQCEEHSYRCYRRKEHRGDCQCRQCIMLYVASFTEAEDSAKLCPVNFESHDEQPKAHYDYYTGDPLDEDAYQQAKADELQAMEDYGVYEVIPITQAYDGKHIGGFPIAHNKEKKVRWRFVATEVNDGHREDNHQGTPPLMIVRAIVSLAASRPDSDGVFRRLLRIWDIRKAFFNANLNETLYLHPGKELCPKGYCWLLKKALYGTRMASQMWGELVKLVMDNGGLRILIGVPGAYYLPAQDELGEMDSVNACHGDDFLAEGHEEQLEVLNEVLRGSFEVTDSGCIGPRRPGEVQYLKRTIGYTDTLPETNKPGFYWIADQKNIDQLIKWGHKGGSKPAPSPGTKATGANIRMALDPLSTARGKEVSSAGGMSLYVSADRPDTMFASKTVMQHVSRPIIIMEARMMRLSRYYAGQPTLVWCYELQEEPAMLRADGDSDWAPSTEELRRSTSGGTIRYGGHLWDAFSATQATQALSSGEAEFYATGSATARGLMGVYFLEEIGRKAELLTGSDSTAGRGICQRHGVGKVRHLELRYLWLQDRVRLKQVKHQQHGCRLLDQVQRSRGHTEALQDVELALRGARCNPDHGSLPRPGDSHGSHRHRDALDDGETNR